MLLFIVEVRGKAVFLKSSDVPSSACVCHVQHVTKFYINQWNTRSNSVFPEFRSCELKNRSTSFGF